MDKQELYCNQRVAHIRILAVQLLHAQMNDFSLDEQAEYFEKIIYNASVGLNNLRNRKNKENVDFNNATQR